MKTIISILLFYCLLSAYGQVDYFGCGTHSSQFLESTKNCVESSPDFTNYYSLKETHIPDNSNTIVKTLHVNINIWQRSDGTGNLIDNPETRARIKQIAIWINNIYQYISQPSNPVPYNYEFLGDSKIRIILDSIYFYRDPSPDSAYYYGGYGNVTYGHNKLLDAYLRNNFPYRTRALNIHLTGSQWLGVGGYSDYGSIESFYHHNPEMSTSDVHDFWFANHWAHEIGHAFDLWHTYDIAWSQNHNQNYFDFLWDLYDTTLHCPVSSSFICLLPSGNNNLMGGSTISHMSALQMGIIHRSTVLENFHNTDFNIRDHVTGYSSEPYLVSNDEVWDFSMKFYQNVIVTTGHTLTIKCETEFVPNTKLIVEPGATLVLDGGKLTNEHYYNHFWQGIELQGNSSLSQLTPGAQGQVILKNGAVIENAMDGITTIGNVEDMTSWDWSKTGGIIKAVNSTFRNCRRGIQFLSYSNVHPRFGTSLPNMSYIKNCTFETTAALPGDIAPYAFISMYEVNDVKIMGNTFQNIFPSANVFELGNGIISIDSKYSVTPICNSGTFPCTSFDKNEFINLGYGIRASATNDMRPITVKNAVFNECHFGIYASTIDYSSIVDNEFIISEWTNGSTKIMMYGYGLYLDQCKHFKTEGNYFHSSNTSRGWTGMYVNNTNIGDLSVTNEVYRNKFENLYSGMVALNNNGGPHQPDGVTFHCDTFYSNTYDIAVLPQPENPSISTLQGTNNPFNPDPKLFVRNWYSADCLLNDENQFKIDYIDDVGDYIFHTTYNQTEYLPQCHDWHLQATGISGFTPAEGDCPIKIGYTPSVIKDNLIQIAIKKNEISNLVDGGQTNYLVGIAQSNIPSGQILQTMLEFSPYLSNEVLLALIERPNAIPAGTMQQILSANSPLSAEVFTAVQNMHPSLPRGIYNQVAVLQTGEMSERDMLPVIDAAYTQQERLLKADLIRYYLNDTTSVQPLDSVKKILAESSVIESKMNLVSTYLESKNFNKATALIDSLRIVDNSLNTFTSKQALSVQVAVLPGTNYAILEDSILMNDLNTQAMDILSYGSLYAINTLEWLNDSLHEELTLIPMPGGNYRSQVETPSNTITDIKNASLQCYPNPAKEKFNAKYELTPVCSAYYLVVQNVKAQEIHRVYLENCEGEIEVIAPSEPGTYYIYIEDCGKTLAVDKIVIVK